MTVIHSIGLKVQELEIVSRGWLVGALADQDLPPSPRAPKIPTRRSLRRAIRQGTLATTVPAFYLPLASRGGFFRTIEPGVLAEFLEIAPNDNGGLQAFLRRYGVFAQEDLSRTKMPPIVRERWKRVVGRDNTPFAMHLSEFWDAYDTIAALSDLTDALQRPDEQRMGELSLFLGRDLIEEYDRQRILDPYAEAQFLLAAITGRWLATVRIAPVEQDGKFIPSIVTTCSRDALYAQLMVRITDGNPLRRCKRLKCERIFVPGPHNNEYCSSACQNLNKRYRQLGKPKSEIERATTSLREE